MIRLLCALAAGTGVHLLVSTPPPSRGSGPAGRALGHLRRTIDRLRAEVATPAIATAMAAGAVIGVAIGAAGFGGAGPAVVLAGFGAAAPVAARRRRDADRHRAAHHVWPRLIEEIRVQTGSLGRSVPQAFFAVGREAPRELRAAFEAAHREWSLTTDLPRALAVFRRLAPDPTAHVTCETLLVAHEIGGIDLDRRLAALADDRRLDVQARRDAESRLAGARFARRFVLLVPLGMAAAGMTIGSGRHAYTTPTGQAVATVALAFVIGCWCWAGRIMRLPVTGAARSRPRR